MSVTSPAFSMQWRRFEALTLDELYELLRFRQSIFVVEQHSPFPDLDGLDQEMEEALSHCREHYPGQLVALTAQMRLVPLYRGFGFEPVGEPFDDFGLTHIDMQLRPHD